MKWIRSFWNRVWNAVMVFWLVFWKPRSIDETTLKLTQSFFEFVVKVQEDNRPYFSQFGFVHPGGEDKPIVTIWAAPGTGSSPENRIKELVEENSSLRAQIDRLLAEDADN